MRGLDYYTRTTFEFIGEDSGLSIAGGGRYDYLVEEIGGPPTPGIGFGAGIERLLLQLERESWARRSRPASTSSSPATTGAARAGARECSRRFAAPAAAPTSTTRAAR